MNQTEVTFKVNALITVQNTFTFTPSQDEVEQKVLMQPLKRDNVKVFLTKHSYRMYLKRVLLLRSCPPLRLLHHPCLARALAVLIVIVCVRTCAVVDSIIFDKHIIDKALVCTTSVHEPGRPPQSFSKC